MKFVLAAILAAHGLAHLVGFVSSWRLATLPELPYKTTTFGGRFDLGDAGIRLVGLLWLVTALAFMGCAVAVTVEGRGAAGFAGVVTIASLSLCAAQWPDTRIGLVVDIGLLAALLFARAATTGAAG